MWLVYIRDYEKISVQRTKRSATDALRLGQNLANEPTKSDSLDVNVNGLLLVYLRPMAPVRGTVLLLTRYSYVIYQNDSSFAHKLNAFVVVNIIVPLISVNIGHVKSFFLTVID